MHPPELPRPRICSPPGINDATRFGVLKMDAIAECHRLESSDPAAKTAGEDHHLADLSLWLRYRAHVFVEDVGRGNDVTVGQRWVAIVGAEGVEDSLGAF